jgi:hypothetical protein
MSLFPAGRFSDLTDSTSQALKYLRDVGLAQSEEKQHETETVGQASPHEETSMTLLELIRAPAALMEPTQFRGVGAI